MQRARRFGLLPIGCTCRHCFAFGGRLVMAILLFGRCGEGATADPDDLRSHLVEFAQERGFTIGGLQSIGREAAVNAQGSVSDRLSVLLQDYNYMLVQDGLGRIEKVVITSRKSPEAAGSAGSATVFTVRVGNHHYVDTDITGPNRVVRTVRLLIDTGATSLVLPTSLIPDLGFKPQDLRPGTSQVVGGAVPTLIGTLGVVRVG